MLAAVSQKLSRVLGARVVASCVCRAGRGRGRGRDRRKWECPAIYATLHRDHSLSFALTSHF